MIEKFLFKKTAFKFIKFLQKEKCLDSFYEIIQSKRSKNTRCIWGHPAEYQLFLRKYYNRPDMWLQSAFDWSNTIQGHMYWARIQTKWLMEIEKNQLNILNLNSTR